jgi:hypothetical protein
MRNHQPKGDRAARYVQAKRCDGAVDYRSDDDTRIKHTFRYKYLDELRRITNNL